MVLSRRGFLRASAAAAAAIGFPSIARAATPWAELPPSAGDLPKFKILEIHLPGGASMWESLWVSHDGSLSGGGGWLGAETTGGPLNWRGLGEYVANLQWHACANVPASSIDTREFGVDANGTPVSWGPATAPLWRTDIFNRCRMLVTQHPDELHAFAAYRTMTGRRFGSPRGASLGAAVQRHFQSLDQQQETPYAYAFGPKGGGGRDYFLKYPGLIGQHPGPSRPLVLTVGDPIGDLLERDAIPDSADALYHALRGQYEDLLRWPEGGAALRSLDFESYDAAGDYLTNASALDVHLGGDELVPGSDAPCVNDPAHGFGDVENATKRSLELAATMLENGARHVTVLDGGLRHSLLLNGRMPYDAHDNQTGKSRNVVETTSAHLFNLFQSLAEIIAAPAGGAGAIFATSTTAKIDLTDTLIVVNTEFNRTPDPGVGTNAEGYSYAGREHFPAGNVALLIGGPVSDRGIHGGFALADGDPESAIATQALTPTDVHAGAMLAAGINPIDPDNFTVGDDFSAIINPGGNAYPDEIRTRLKQRVLGITGEVDSLTFGS